MMKAKFHQVLFILLIAILLSLLMAACSHQHNYGDWKTEKEPSCTEDGLQTRTCLDCNRKRTKALPATGHREGEWITAQEATCTADGSRYRVCGLCNATLKTETIPAFGGHSYVEKLTTRATCVSNGVKSFICSRCNDAYTEPIICKTYTATEIYDNHLNSVGEIVTYDINGNELTLGTCFVYAADGEIITSYQVIENAYSAKIFLNNTSYPVVQVLAYDKEIDIAVLKIIARDLPQVTLCKRSHNVGEVVYALGCSKGQPTTLSEGFITDSDQTINDVSYTQHDAPISSSNSGGPLINKHGEVIGINTRTRESQNLNYAIRVSELSKLNYNYPLTMAEHYKKESNVFTQLKNYIITNGSYSNIDDSYGLIIGESTSEDGKTTYLRTARYFPIYNSIVLDLLMGDGTDFVCFEIKDQLSCVYFWRYLNNLGYDMYGTFDATTFDKNTLLEYSYDNISHIAYRNSTRRLAATMIDIICAFIADDFSAIGITAKDLGFTLYP